MLFGNNNAPCTYVLPDGVTTSTSTNMLWMYQVLPYTKNAQIFNCPSCSNRWPVNAYSSSLGYGFNDTYCNRASLGNLVVPAETILLVDCTYYLSDWDTNATGDNHQYPNTAHNDGANCVFVDGHAKWAKDTTLGYYDAADHAAPPSPNMWDNTSN